MLSLVSEVGEHYGVSSTIDRYLFEANANQVDRETLFTIAESLFMVLFQYVAENAHKEISKAIYKLKLLKERDDVLQYLDTMGLRHKSFKSSIEDREISKIIPELRLLKDQNFIFKHQDVARSRQISFKRDIAEREISKTTPELKLLQNQKDGLQYKDITRS